MNKIWAIGDIHGCCKTFYFLLFKKLKITQRDKIYCLGDYIDRGPDSKGVIDLILKLRNQGYQIHTIRGNHENLMMNSIRSDVDFNKWIQNGGENTLRSFKINSYQELQPKYKMFFSRTKYYISHGKYLFSHAGFNFDNENIFEDKRAMLWMRNCSVEKSKLNGRIIIHGHTPRHLNTILKYQNTNIVNLDAGCVFKDHEHLGYLVAFNVQEGIFIESRNIE